MNITSFKDINFTVLDSPNPLSTNKRIIGHSEYNDVTLIGTNIFYPNVLLYANNTIISPYDEKIMSLNKSSFYDNNIYNYDNCNINNTPNNIVDVSVFFFIYNFDNYYHFIYDTLPYLYIFLQLKQRLPNLKLLINYPNERHLSFYKFNLELLEKIIDIDNDLIIHKANNLYKKIFVASSLTHGGYSNDAPCNEIFKIYDLIKQHKMMQLSDCLPKKIYISRRTWLNNDTSNIGTNYTIRRKMINETELIKKLISNYGFVEIFAENLTTNEKILLFNNADIVVGSIGGGMSNLLFAESNVKSIVIVSPYFLEINGRFKYCMEHTNIKYFNNTAVHTDGGNIPMYCRVKITKECSENNKIGEIIKYDATTNKYLVNISIKNVAGFNENNTYLEVYFSENDFILLDKGLNSPYSIDLDLFFSKFNDFL